MRNEHNFMNQINHANVALEAEIQCDCGNDAFCVSHSGVQCKGLFGSVSIGKRKGQLVIKCKCPECSREYLLFDSTKDGSFPRGCPLQEYRTLKIKNTEKFKIKMSYNFLEENYKTDKFEMFFLDIKISEAQKYMRVCEM